MMRKIPFYILGTIRSTDTPYDEERNDDDTNSLWASQSELKTAIRHAFQSSTLLTNSNNDDDDNRTVILSLQRLAMDAIFHISQQCNLQQHSSVSMDMERGVRVVATSTCIGTTAIGGIHNQCQVSICLSHSSGKFNPFLKYGTALGTFVEDSRRVSDYRQTSRRCPAGACTQ